MQCPACKFSIASRRRYLTLMCLPRFSGVIVIQNYRVVLYGEVGFTPTMSLVLTGVWGSIGTVSAIFAAFDFDFWGRRPTMAS